MDSKNSLNMHQWNAHCTTRCEPNVGISADLCQVWAALHIRYWLSYYTYGKAVAKLHDCNSMIWPHLKRLPAWRANKIHKNSWNLSAYTIMCLKYAYKFSKRLRVWFWRYDLEDLISKSMHFHQSLGQYQGFWFSGNIWGANNPMIG